MKVVVATSEMQGMRENDSITAQEGDVLCPHTYMCFDDNCLCQFTFVSPVNGLVSTTFKVVDKPEYNDERLFQEIMEYLIKRNRLVKQANMTPVEVTKIALDKVKDITEITSRFPEGMILEVHHQLVRTRVADGGATEGNGEKRGRGRPLGSKNKPKA